MAQRVGIVAVAQTKYEESKLGLRLEELAYQPVKEVLEQTGLKYTEDGTGIDFSICATDDFWDASTLSDTVIGDVIGGHYRAAEKVSQDGDQAALYGTVAILSGHYDIVLVVAHPDFRAELRRQAQKLFFLVITENIKAKIGHRKG